MKVLVVGGSGLIGRQVVAQLTQLGHEAVSASPSSGVNTVTGEGVAEAVAGVDTVVDVSNSPSWADDDVLNFFTTSTRNLLDAERAADVRHHVALSIVGADRTAESGYMRAKIAQEKEIVESGAPYSIVRATQFFEFVDGIADSMADGDTVRAPHGAFQPIAAADVATAVTRAAAADPVNGVVNIAGRKGKAWTTSSGPASPRPATAAGWSPTMTPATTARSSTTAASFPSTGKTSSSTPPPSASGWPARGRSDAGCAPRSP